MFIMGIDPGVNGGFCVMSGDETHVFKNEDDAFYDWLSEPNLKVICLEQVNSGVFGSKKVGQSMGVKSAFTFGNGFGRIEGAIRALQSRWICSARLERVLPNQWQKGLGINAKGDKKILKAIAAELFPKVKVTGWNQDALLIAHYARKFLA